MNRAFLLCLPLFTTACGGSTTTVDAEASTPEDTPAQPDVALIAEGARIAVDWRPETMHLPEDFAPGLPPGIEELRFAPGMFEADSPEYWTYAFVISFDEEVRGREGLLDVLEQYYVGLIRSVAEGKGLELDREPARVSLDELGEGRFRAEIDLVDSFVTGKPLLLHMELGLSPREGGSLVTAAASPQPVEHEVWPRLRAVVAFLESEL